MTKLMRHVIAGALLVGASASAHSQTAANRASGASFDYYLLTLSWAPDFCAAPGGFKDPNECGAGRHIGFIVHGLWPQNNARRGPENCAAAGRVSSAVINATLSYIPSPSLIQHEWSAHGTCSGLSADEYFATLRKARNAVNIPVELASLSRVVMESPRDVEKQFAAANAALPAAAIRATCTGGTLQEVRVCLDRNLRGRACTNSAGLCTASRIKILPIR